MACEPIRFLLTAMCLCASAAASAQERTVRFELVPGARSPAATEWRYTLGEPASDWNAEAFDDAAWAQGRGGFGAGTVNAGSPIGNGWSDMDIWMRKEFQPASLDFDELILAWQHDDDAEVYLNGVPAVIAPFRTGFPEETPVSSDAKAALKPGRNVLAVHCRNNGGGPQYIDAGLLAVRTMKATRLVDDARFYGTDWKWIDRQPAAGWNDVGFDASDWSSGTSGFGSPEFGSDVGTAWSQYEIWIRKTFTADKPFPAYLLSYLHDDDAEIYVNGSVVLQEGGSGGEYVEKALTADRVPLNAGENVIAVHCANSGGGPQFIDAGLLGLEPLEPTTAAGPRSARRTRRALHAAGGKADLSALGSDAVLDFYSRDGRKLASMRAGGARSVLPAGLPAGAVPFRWHSSHGSGAGLLIGLQ
jgi:hypothetical protein